MSMRPLIYPVKSVEPVRDALGSNDVSLLDRITDGYKSLYANSDTDSLKRVCDLGRSFIEGELHDGKELGEWQEVIHFLARGLHLLETEYPINDDWKWIAWNDYFEEVGQQLSIETRQLLHGLIEGRPLKADGMTDDGSYYAWLGDNEVEELNVSLVQMQGRRPEISSIIDGFHRELVQWLNICRGKDVLLVAS